MAKIGRNQPCPCGSGKKFKRCCVNTIISAEQSQQAAQQQVSVSEEITALQAIAAEKRAVIKIIGVFIFFCTEKGDAWLLELSDKDAIVVAKDGQKLDIDIVESDDTIEINWSHQFEIKKNKFTTTAYSDKLVEPHEGCPVPAIKDALLKIQKNFSSELLDSIHVD